MSVARLIDGAAARLRAGGVLKPRREANRLWAWLNRMSPGEAYFSRERSSDAALVKAYEAAVERRLAGEPMAYVLGHTGFRNLEIRCDRRALIPRPESEGLIDHALSRVRSGRALDLGTGTGCLALALADEGAFDSVIAVECSAAALELAAENRVLTGKPIRLIQSDLGAALRAERFELLVTNPPYLTEAEYLGLDESVRRWEPRLALASGADGLDATRRILRDGTALLAPGGWLVMELDSMRSGIVTELAHQAGYREVAVWDDLFGRPRYLTARREHTG
ncbi:MAG TPA: peptide chain release factor N(5)-glutamine methyltransferase [Gemmatimonadales bacterium]|nr:peptide chain release factor N(5)-glutamine methyltransferase [Gemmatimonadales bacterium]